VRARARARLLGEPSALSSTGLGSARQSASDTVYELFLCHGDLTNQDCKECVGDATYGAEMLSNLFFLLAKKH
jgi:hypothetical protein